MSAARPPRFGYVPYSDDLSNPGDRRRFPFWASERGVTWEVFRPDGDYDVVVLASTADLARWVNEPRSSTRLVYEIIDSYLDIPERHWKIRLRGAAKFASGELSRPVMSYRRAIEAMCRRADAVVCSSPEQQRRLGQLNGEVHAILDAHVDLVHRHKTDFSVGNVVNLVWEGLPYTLDDLHTIKGALRQVDRQQPLALHLVTDLTYAAFAQRFVRRQSEHLARGILPRTYIYQWNELLLSDVVTACDIAIVPLDLKDPLARAKPENKLLLLWRLGMPTLASSTPAYERTMAAANIDLTCRDERQWATRLQALIEDETLRRASGTAGRQFVEGEHSRERILARWDRLFSTVLG